MSAGVGKKREVFKCLENRKLILSGSVAPIAAFQISTSGEVICRPYTSPHFTSHCLMRFSDESCRFEISSSEFISGEFSGLPVAINISSLYGI